LLPTRDSLFAPSATMLCSTLPLHSTVLRAVANCNAFYLQPFCLRPLLALPAWPGLLPRTDVSFTIAFLPADARARYRRELRCTCFFARMPARGVETNALPLNMR